ncbi:GNAT family N-acetyltransferase, partial [Zavarzinia sp.]|uniref:GNAT family N-acetyltransferase n=1 Tax=Zavarzinia sp. TaxID=2027920 RepID=UPI003BB6DFE7
MTARIFPLDAAAAEARLGELAAILVDAVEQGASVNFMAGIATEDAAGFWRRQLPGLVEGEKQLLVAEEDGRLVGTILLMFAQQPNAPHRAEIGKMLVHSGLRRRGLGRRLLA